MILNKIIHILIICLFVCETSAVYSQEKREIELTAQEIVARVDRLLEYPRGQIKGKLVHITPNGASRAINIWGAVAQEDTVFKLSSERRGEEVKILYNLKGESIWVFNPHAVKVFNKRGIDKYDSILATNYFFIDLSNAALQSNYTARITGDAFIKGFDCYKLDLDPLFKSGAYGLLTLYVKKNDYIPLRIDFHDNDKVIFKTMSIVKTIIQNNRIRPVRYDMLHIRRGSVTMLEFFEFDDSIKFDKKIFRHETLGE